MWSYWFSPAALPPLASLAGPVGRDDKTQRRIRALKRYFPDVHVKPVRLQESLRLGQMKGEIEHDERRRHEQVAQVHRPVERTPHPVARRPHRREPAGHRQQTAPPPPGARPALPEASPSRP